MPRDIVTKPRRVRPSVGHLSPLAHVFVYVLLAAMLAVDYILLAQALTLLLRNDSQYGCCRTSPPSCCDGCRRA